MYLVGIDIGKLKHSFCIVNQDTGEVIKDSDFFNNNEEGFKTLISSFKAYKKDKVLIGMEDTGHYHFALLKYLLDKGYTVALINPVTTDLTRKMSGSISKNDKLDALTICDVLSNSSRKKLYRVTRYNNFETYEQKGLTRHHHNLKEELNVYTNRLQKCIDIVFPEYNSLFNSKYGIVYMNVLKAFGSAYEIAHSDIRNIRSCFKTNSRGKTISLTPEQLKKAASKSIGIHSLADEIQIKHLIGQIELINNQIDEIDKKIEEFSKQNNSPILEIPGIGHFSSTSILSELGDINNFSSFKQIIKFSGIAPIHYESSQFNAEHTKISKKGSKYLRKTLYQAILPVIKFNPTFRKYYELKRSQGKSHRCAEGHCVRKLLRVIFHLVKTNSHFDPALLR